MAIRLCPRLRALEWTAKEMQTNPRKLYTNSPELARKVVPEIDIEVI